MREPGFDPMTEADQRRRLERMIVGLHVRMAQAGPAEADAAIDAALAGVGRAGDFDRTYVFRFCGEGTCSNTHEWVAPGVEPMKDQLQNLPVEWLDPWLPLLEGGFPVHVEDVSALPAEDRMRASLLAQGIRSILVAPMIEDGRLFGLVGYDVVRERRPLGEHDLFLLQSVGAALAALMIRRRDAEALKESRNRRAATLAALPDLLLETDREGRCVGWHGTPPEWLVLRTEDMVGKTPEELLSPSGAAEVRKAMAEAELKGSSGSFYYAVAGAGGLNWREFRVSARSGETLSGFLCVIRDVTARIEAETALRAREAMLDAIFAEAPLGVVVSDGATGAVLDANPAYLRLSGRACEDLNGATLSSLVAPEDRERTRELFATLKATGRYGPAALQIDRAAGGAFAAIVRGVAAETPSGRQLVWNFVEDQTERMRHVAELSARSEESEAMRARLEAAIEALPDGFVYFDAEDRLVLCNRRYREYYPRSAHAMMIGASFEAIIRAGVAAGEYEAAVGREEAFLEERMATHRSHASDFEQTLADGRCIRVIERRTPEGGRVGLRIDITAQKESERRLQHVIDGARVGTWEWDIESGANVVNARWAEMLGLRLEAIQPVTINVWEELCHPDDIQETKRRLAGVFAGAADQFEHTFRMRHADGGWVWVLSSGRVVRRGPGGAPEAMSGIHIDISEQKAREHALRDARDELSRALHERDDAERRFFDIAEVSEDWFWEQDANLRFTYISPGYERKVGSFAEVVGKRREEVMGTEAEPLSGLSWEALHATVEAHEPFRDFIYRRKGRFGQDVWVRIGGSPIFDRFGDFAGYRGVGSDVTDLVSARERAEAGSRAKSAFLANMSHEIRTPLNGVLGMAELLAAAPLERAQRDMVNTIRDSGEALLNVINDILDLARVESGRLQAEAIPFTPAALLDRIEALHGPTALKQGVALHVRRGEGAGAARLGDPQRLTQILHNLVGNAVKFSPAGEVFVAIEAPPGAPMVIEVRDTGIGMDAEQQRRVFDEFEQGDSTITRRFGGTGLGLPIVRRLVALLGGALSLESAPGAGSTFRVTLDAPEAAAISTPVTAPAPAPAEIAGLRALVAEDNPTNRMILEAMLARLGVVAEIAVDGAEALARWAPGRFDLLLFDIAMPEMDGLTALTEIRRRAAALGVEPTPAAAVTAHAMAGQLESYRAAGFAACVTKPVRLETLAEAIMRLAAPAIGRKDGTDAPARTGDPQIHNLVL